MLLCWLRAAPGGEHPHRGAGWAAVELRERGSTSQRQRLAVAFYDLLQLTELQLAHAQGLLQRVIAYFGLLGHELLCLYVSASGNALSGVF